VQLHELRLPLAEVAEPALRFRAWQPSVDGGGDALCKDRVGPIADQISLDFALEAKCYAELPI
jgi:hypothetical protein